MGFAGPPDPDHLFDNISATNDNQGLKHIWFTMQSHPRDNLSEPGANSSGKIKISHLHIGLVRQVAWAGIWKSMMNDQLWRTQSQDHIPTSSVPTSKTQLIRSALSHRTTMLSKCWVDSVWLSRYHRMSDRYRWPKGISLAAQRNFKRLIPLAF